MERFCISSKAFNQLQRSATLVNNGTLNLEVPIHILCEECTTHRLLKSTARRNSVKQGPSQEKSLPYFIAARIGLAIT